MKAFFERLWSPFITMWKGGGVKGGMNPQYLHRSQMFYILKFNTHYCRTINGPNLYKADEGVDRQKLLNANKMLKLRHVLIFNPAQYKGTLSCTHVLHTNMFGLYPLIIAACVYPTLSATSIDRLKYFSNRATSLSSIIKIKYDLCMVMKDSCYWVK